MESSDESAFFVLLGQINGAAEAGFHLIAIAMAAALPDICAALSSPNGSTTAKKYKNWCQRHLTGEKFSFVSPEDLYSIRCGVLHQGRFGGLEHNVARVLFTTPGAASFSNCLIRLF